MLRKVKVPSRVNIIGEHTDYVGGLAMPFACSPYLEITVDTNPSEYSGDATVIDLWKCAGGWPTKIHVESEIPIGKGMSSSAALCLGIVLAVNESIDPMDACIEAQRIEHEILGTNCGLLDQIAIMFARKNCFSLINFTNLEISQFDIPHDWKFKLVDSGVYRALSQTSYNTQKNANEHAKQENARVELAIGAGSVELGKLLNETHQSLIDLGVSNSIVNKSVEELQKIDGVLGARMMGGGFGGMILVLVSREDVLPSEPLVISSGPPVLEEII